MDVEELAEGALLAGRYLLGPVVGHGAMGQVQLAEDTRLARPVAIKSLRPELARYADVRQRFGHEARAAARINHPNVVRVYDSGEEGRIPYLVMECLPGSTLVDELAWGPLELPRARRVGLDVLGALDAAHRLGIVHRDVKPGNILLSAALDGPVKVSDFGIAKSADERSLTDSGSLVGTAGYLAPERVAGEPAAPASDLYSLGVVLYEALAGRKPYEGETSLAVALAIHMGGAPSLLELRPDVDPAFADVVDRAIARDPAERWPSAAAMAEALQAWRPGAARPAAAAVGGGAGAAAVAAPTEALDPPPAAGRGADPATRAVAPAPTVPLVPADGRAGARTGLLATRRRRRTAAAAGAAAAALLLVGVVAAMGGRGPDEPAATVPPTTAELVAGPDTLPPPPEESTVAPPRSVAPAIPRSTRRAAAPATVANPPPTRATTTTPARVTTTRSTPPSTAPPSSTPATSPSTVPIAAEPASEALAAG